MNWWLLILLLYYFLFTFILLYIYMALYYNDHNKIWFNYKFILNCKANIWNLKQFLNEFSYHALCSL